MENWTLKNEQEEEIKTIKERNISIKLSNADIERLCNKAGGVGLTVPELLENFIGDLIHGTYSNGSDERMYANQWFDRCWFSMGFGDYSFLQWLISNDCTEEAVTTWNDLQDAKNDLQESLTEDELDEEYADNCKEDIAYFQESLNDLFNEYKQQQREIKDISLENEMEKVLQWYEEMEKMKNSENPKSALHPGEETAIINSIGGIQMNDNEILQAILTEIKGIKQKQDKMESDLSSVKNDLSGVKNDVSSLKSDVSGLKEDVSGLKSDVSGLKEDVSAMKLNQDSLESAVLKVNLTLENETNKKIDLMYESHQDILDKLKKAEQIDETKSRVSIIEGVVKKHSDDIRELKTKIG